MTASCSCLHALYFSPDAGPAMFCRGGEAGLSHNPNPSPVGPWTESVKIPDSKVALYHPYPRLDQLLLRPCCTRFCAFNGLYSDMWYVMVIQGTRPVSAHPLGAISVSRQCMLAHRTRV